MSRQGPLGAAHSQSDRYRRRLLAAAGLSNNLLFSNLNTTMAVKSSASRTAPATAALGALSGYLAKRDEQHQWRRRFCVLAPQAFLYYFEDSSADAPRGVIDLEGADVSVGDGNVVHIVTPGTHDTEGRRFYFQADSADDAAAWVSALVRERYFNVRDERDAYRDLQHDLSAQAAASATLMTLRPSASTFLAVAEPGRSASAAESTLKTLMDVLSAATTVPGVAPISLAMRSPTLCGKSIQSWSFQPRMRLSPHSFMITFCMRSGTWAGRTPSELPSR